MEEALQITQLITNILVMLLFLGLVIMVFSLIKHAKKLTEKVEGFSTEFKEIKPKILETVDKINFLSDNVNTVVTKVNDNIDVLSTVVDQVKKRTESILDFEEQIQNRITPPIMETANTISAISVGIKTFFESLKNKRSVNGSKLESKYQEKLDDLEVSLDDVNKELDEVNARLTDLQK